VSPEHNEFFRKEIISEKLAQVPARHKFIFVGIAETIWQCRKMNPTSTMPEQGKCPHITQESLRKSRAATRPGRENLPKKADLFKARLAPVGGRN
jgi:hypothetical protein